MGPYDGDDHGVCDCMRCRGDLEPEAWAIGPGPSIPEARALARTSRERTAARLQALARSLLPLASVTVGLALVFWAPVLLLTAPLAAGVLHVVATEYEEEDVDRNPGGL